MSDFKNKTITTKGLELLSKAMSGGKLEFTRIEMGSGTFSGDLSSVENLVEVKQNLQLTNIVRKGGQVTLSAILKIEDIVSEYDWTEIGVYAKGADEVEVLYMYGYTTNSSFISKDSLNEKLINVTVIVSNVANVTAVIDSSIVYLTREALEDHNKSELSHNDIRELVKQLKVEIENIDVSEDIQAHNVDGKAHADIRSMIQNIDLSSINSHTTTVGEGIKTHVTSARDNTNTHISNSHATTRAGLLSAHDTTRATVNTARDYVASHVSNERVNVVNAVNSARDIINSYVISRGNRGYVVPSVDWKASLSNIYHSAATTTSNMKKNGIFYVPKDGTIRIDALITRLSGSVAANESSNRIWFYVAALSGGGYDSSRHDTKFAPVIADFANMADGTEMPNGSSVINTSLLSYETGISCGSYPFDTTVEVPLYFSVTAGLYFVGFRVYSAGANYPLYAYVSARVGYTEVI